MTPWASSGRPPLKFVGVLVNFWVMLGVDIGCKSPPRKCIVAATSWVPQGNGIAGYPIQKVTKIYNKATEMYNKVSEHAISSWNVLSLLQSEVAYIGTGHILP